MSTITPSPAPAPAAKPAPAAPSSKSTESKPASSTSTKAPADKTTVSADAKTKADPQASNVIGALGDNFKQDTVKADTWKKGPNDTIEGMLKGKGFSLKDIYSKGTNGKTMVDSVLSANNLKDARKMRDGQEMIVPDLGNKGAGTATSGLKPGEKTPQKTVGDSTNATRARQDGSTTTQTLAKDSKGQVTTQVDTKSKGEQDEIKTTALKGGLKGKAGPDGVQLQNGQVKVNQDLDERKRDGGVENAGRNVAEFFGVKPEPVAPVPVHGKEVTTAAIGNDISVSADGKKVAHFDQDADDSMLERGGAAVDKGIAYVADKGSKAIDYTADLAKQAGGAVTNAASGMWNWVTGG